MAKRTAQGVRWIAGARLLRDVAVLLLALWAVFIGLQLIGAAVPDRVIAQQLEQSIDEGLYERSYPPTGLGGRHDAYTDCVVVGTGLGDASLSVLDRALLMPRIGSCTNGGVEQIRAIAAGEEVSHVYYLRYWAGYAPLVRPALALGGMAAVNAVALVALVASLVAAWAVVSRRAGLLLAAVLIGPVLVTTDALVTPGGAAEHALSLATAFGGVALVAWASLRGLRWMTLAAVVAGAVFNYVDLLNNPNLAWTLTAAVGPAILVVRGASARRVAAAALAATGGWLVGFGGAFAERWVTAIAAAGPTEALRQILDNISVRSGLANQDADGAVREGLGQATLANLRTFAQLPLAVPMSIVALLLAAVLLVLAVRRSGAHRLGGAVVVAMIALVVPFWYEVMTNHSQVHAFFTYRAVPAALGVLLAAAAAAFLGARAENRGPVSGCGEPLDVPGDGPDRAGAAPHA